MKEGAYIYMGTDQINGDFTKGDRYYVVFNPPGHEGYWIKDNNEGSYLILDDSHDQINFFLQHFCNLYELREKELEKLN